MKCHICDRQLSPDEIKLTTKYERGKFAPCGTCLSIIEEVFEPLSEEELDLLIDTENFSDEDFA